MKIKVNYLLFILMLLGIFEPTYFETGFFHNFFVACKLISIVFLYDFFKNYKKYKILAGRQFIRYLFVLLMFFVWICISIQVTGTGSFSYVLNLVDTFSYVVANCVFYTKYGKDVFNIYRKVIGGLLFINFITLFTQNATYFFGHKNGITPYIILYLFGYLGIVTSSKAINNGKWMLVIFVLLIYSIVFDCSTATGCILILGVLFWGNQIKNYKGAIKIIAGICITTGVLLYFSGYLESILSIMTAMLRRSSTFTGRNAIWRWSVNYIQQSPVFGHGVYVEFTPWSNINNHVYSAHNLFLDVSCRFGIISAVILIILYLYSIKCLIKKLTSTNLIKVSLLLALLLYNLMEAGSIALFTVMITFFFYHSLIENIITGKEQK